MPDVVVMIGPWWDSIKSSLSFGGGLLALLGAGIAAIIEYSEHKPVSITADPRPPMRWRRFVIACAGLGGFIALVGSRIDSNQQMRLQQEIANLSGETLASVTGGRSFPVFMAPHNGESLSSPLPLQVFVFGEHAMFDFRAEIQQPMVATAGKTPQVIIRPIPVPMCNLLPGNNDLGIAVAAPGKYVIRSVARNGNFTETFEIYQCKGSWDEELKVYGWGQVLREVPRSPDCQ